MRPPPLLHLGQFTDIPEPLHPAHDRFHGSGCMCCVSAGMRLPRQFANTFSDTADSRSGAYPLQAGGRDVRQQRAEDHEVAAPLTVPSDAGLKKGTLDPEEEDAEPEMV